LISVTSSTRRLACHWWNRYKGSLSVLRSLGLVWNRSLEHPAQSRPIHDAALNTKNQQCDA
jgi:hypothetical protein